MPKISVACWDYDRALPVLDGRVPVKGFEVDPITAPPGTLFPLSVSTAPYDVTELSFASYLIQTSRDECAYIGLPIYLSRAFRHGAIYVRTDAGISEPKDLEGKRVGVPEYAMTLALWVRGILSDSFGVDVSKLRYRTGGLNVPGRVERLVLDLPADLEVVPLGKDVSLNAAILAGELDAIIAAAPPQSFADRNPLVQRLIENPGPAEQAYFKETGIFPIMHIVGVKRDVAEAHPDLCPALISAFGKAREIAMARVRDIAEGSANRTMLPWFADSYECAVSEMGANFWSYGVQGNEDDLEAICRYANEQHLLARPLSVSSLFHPSAY
jgi:4,5-dihydroxyphthalate decarboxylase